MGLNRMNESLNKKLDDAIAAIEDARQAAHNVTGLMDCKVLDLLDYKRKDNPYPWENSISGHTKFWLVAKEYVAKKLPYSGREANLRWCDEQLALAKPIQEENAKRCEANKVTADMICIFLTAIGLKNKQYYESGKGRNRRTGFKSADWVNGVHRLCCHEDNGYAVVKNWHEKAVKAVNAHFDRVEKEEKEKAKKREADQLWNDAVAFLTERGKKMGDDYEGEHAISAANNIAFDEEVAKLSNDPTPIDFSGGDYCESCEGWTPGEHRCCCGNRRVTWAEGFGHTFKSPYVVAEAY